MEYICRGRVTSVVGQNVERRIGGIFNARHPIGSTITLAKEMTKGLLARAGSEKYGLHSANNLMRPTRLRDGRQVIEIFRCNPHWGGVSVCETGLGVGEVITQGMLDLLVERGGGCVLYTHLGKLGPGGRRFPQSAVEGFRRLAASYGSGKILVATTRRLLDFCRYRERLESRQYRDGDVTYIEVSGDAPMAAMAGLTYYCDDPARTRLSFNGREFPQLQRNAPDETGRGSVSIPWKRLTYPST